MSFYEVMIGVQTVIFCVITIFLSIPTTLNPAVFFKLKIWN